jgi:hypothetical protein
VTLAAVAAILGPALFILLGILMLVTAFVPTPQAGAPAFLRIVSFVMCFVMLGFAGWGITTAVGLFRLRVWLVDSGFQRAAGIRGRVFGLDDLDHPDAADAASFPANHVGDKDRDRRLL